MSCLRTVGKGIKHDPVQCVVFDRQSKHATIGITSQYADQTDEIIEDPAATRGDLTSN